MGAIMRQMKAIVEYDASICSEKDASKWKVSVDASKCPENLLRAMKKTRNNKLTFVVHFTESFPFEPPFVRVEAPVFVQGSGHVLIGGGICSQALSDSGWLPTFKIESLIHSLLILIDSGNPEIVKNGRYCYSEEEARESYKRAKMKYAW